MTEFLTFTVLGVVTGSIYAVGASGLVVTYTTSGVFNFAHGAVGMMAAFLYWELRIKANWPAPLALVVVIVVAAPVFGALVERFLIRNLRGAAPVTYMVVTIGLMLGLIGLANTLWPPDVSRQLPLFFGASNRVHIAGVNVTWHEITTVAVAVLVAVLLRLTLYRSRVGVGMRAQVDDRDLTALNGARPGRISMLSWALGSSLAAVAGILFAPILQLDVNALTLLIVNAYAAAMIGRLRSLPLTYVGALLLGLASSYAVGYLPASTVYRNLEPSIPALFLFATLLFLPEGRLRTAGVVRSISSRPPSLRMSLVGAGLLITAVALLMATVDDTYVLRLAEALGIGLVMLSLVPLTGYGGQVSLCQMSFAGIGAFMMVKLGSGGSPLGLVAAFVVAAVVGAVVALPALRLQGLYLALATMAFAVLAQNLFFNDNRVFGDFGSATVARVKIFGLSLSGNRVYGFVLGVVFALVGVGVLALRRSSFGRKLSAMKDSPAACATLGLSTVRTKLAVFALSAGIAGLAGALIGGINESVSSTDYAMLQSLPVLLLAVIGGINAVSGALLGGIFLSIFFPFFADHVTGIVDVIAFIVAVYVVTTAVAALTRSPARTASGGVDYRTVARRGLFLGGVVVVVVGVVAFAHHEAPSFKDLVFLGTGLAGISLGRSPEGAAADIAANLKDLAASAGVGGQGDVDEVPLPGPSRALEAEPLVAEEPALSAAEPAIPLGADDQAEVLADGAGRSPAAVGRP